MKAITVNVGLNVGNSEPEFQMSKTRIVMDNIFPWGYDYKIVNDPEERCLVCTGYPVSDISEMLVKAAENLKQNAIAYMVGTTGFMAHAPNATERYEFDINKFHTL